MAKTIDNEVKEGIRGISSLDALKHYFLYVPTGEIFEVGNYFDPVTSLASLNRESEDGRMNTKNLLNNYHITYGDSLPMDIDEARRLNHIGRMDQFIPLNGKYNGRVGSGL